MKITGSAGRGNTFTEINIGHVENINTNVKEVYTHTGNPITATMLINGIANVTRMLNTSSVPLRFKGKEFHQFSANLCEENGNYYIDLTIK